MLGYSRLIYMNMSYLYGKKFVGAINSLIKSLREELYNEPYDQINWNKARNTVAKVCQFIIYIFKRNFY
ncbi:putative lupeol synthase [Medicago truncatula]|uniref:Putative lupeol synthase n=1 Tax=Medicago truncatula TaxID=3880 RepID=A0A396HJC1_MEDTR|nr:putative lupeol synthase [Medicago truncatula]